MPWQKTRQNPKKSCKIRKRVSSSSSSSSVGNCYRFKRAILVGKKVSSSTPVPTWKGIMDSGSRSSVQKLHNFEINGAIGSNNHNQIRKKEGFSARKLAATLWEINGLQSHGGDRAVFEKINGSKVGAQKRRSSATLQKHENIEYFPNVEELDTAAKLSSIEVGKNNSSFKTRLKDVNKSLIVLKELVKELFRIITHEEQHSSRIILVSALRVELDRARLKIDTLSKSLAEDNKVVWKNKGKEIIKEAVSSIEIERKLRRQAERINKKLGVELANSRAHLSMAMKELEKEKRAKEILEHTCDELAKGIGEERVEIENDRKMMQLTDVLREERLQMKLTDAKYEYEEKNADLYRLKTDIDRKSDFRMKTQFGSLRNEDSGESELHSIELSVDEEVFKGRRSLSDKIQWENICLKRSISDGMEWEFSGRKKQGNNVNQGIIRSSSESPAISTGKSSCLREACNAILLDLDSRKDYR